MTDREYMQIAIDISKKAAYPFGAIIVKDDKIVGRSDAIPKNGNDRLYSHSEYRAIRDAIESGFAGDRFGGLYGGLENCTIYSSCQPCMICMGVILYKKIKRVVYGARLSDSSKYVVKEIETNPEELVKISKNVEEVEIVPDLMRAEAAQVLKEWGEKNNK